MSQRDFTRLRPLGSTLQKVVRHQNTTGANLVDKTLLAAFRHRGRGAAERHVIVAAQLGADCTVSQEVRVVAFDACVPPGHRASGSGATSGLIANVKTGERWFK